MERMYARTHTYISTNKGGTDVLTHKKTEIPIRNIFKFQIIQLL